MVVSRTQKDPRTTWVLIADCSDFFAKMDTVHAKLVI